LSTPMSTSIGRLPWPKVGFHLIVAPMSIHVPG
jgi:hypothetical protein